MAEESGATGREAESLQRRLQLLEEEAEKADSNLRDTNEKYVIMQSHFLRRVQLVGCFTRYGSLDWPP